MPSAPTDWRRRAGWFIAGIIVLAAALRFWTIGSGLPFLLGVDEPEIMDRALHMVRAGEWNPHGFFDYPTLSIYMHAVVVIARFLAGAMRGEWTTLDQVWAGELYLWARSVTAFLSVLTVYVVYRAGLRWSATTALVAAAAMAVQPQLVREAHYALTDTPLTFLVALTMLLSLCASETSRLRWFILAGAVSGLAAATKYNGGTAILMPLAAILHTDALRVRTLALLGVIGGAAVAFLAGAPYSLLDLPAFLNAFAALMQHYNQERVGSDPPALTYLKYIAGWFGVITPGGRLFRSASIVALTLASAGAASFFAGLFNAAGRVKGLIVLIFPLVYFWFISNHTLIFARYAMPLLPAICLAFGRGVDLVWEAAPAWLPGRRARQIVLAVALLALLPPAIQALSFDANRRQISTTELTARWLTEHVGPGELVVIESTEMKLPPTIRSENTLRLISEPLESYRSRGVVYLVSSSTETDKYFNDPARFAHQVAAYKEMLHAATIVNMVPPIKGERPGPTWQVLKLNK
ncbi:MAG TPA: phospholipid carrier-dependent glycosyltransferase [Vicinamibacterales bacterium]|nr:phospholipid carrier-dependent glycosyltransferase [Vicinamibacterales bacterium]